MLAAAIVFSLVPMSALQAFAAKSYGDAEGNGIMFDLTGAGTFTVAIDPATNEITVTGDIV